MASADMICTIGSKETLNTTFLTKKLLVIIDCVLVCRLSAKKNQGIIPAINHRIKGMFSTGTLLNPT